MGADAERNHSTFEKHYLLRIDVKPVLRLAPETSHYRVILDGRWERIACLRERFWASWVPGNAWTCGPGVRCGQSEKAMHATDFVPARFQPV